MELLQYFLGVLTPWHLAVLTLGTIGGLLLGATPGLSPTLAVALLIPFTFSMDAIPSLILLGSVYTGTIAGGAVSAILLSIPGAPANIATTLDGHPLARNGRAAEALHYCFLASLVGGLFGIIILIFFTPPLAELALRFGPSHLFWVAILGVTVIGSLGSDSVLKGLLAGAAGLWLATIGYDPVFGEERFVYSEHLTGGIHIIAALVGLFAVPQVLHMLVTKGKSDSATAYPLGTHRLLESVRTTLSRWRALMIGSVVGTIIE